MGLLFFFKTREDNQLLEKLNTEDIVTRIGTHKICICCKSGIYQMCSLVTTCGSDYK